MSTERARRNATMRWLLALAVGALLASAIDGDPPARSAAGDGAELPTAAHEVPAAEAPGRRPDADRPPPAEQQTEQQPEAAAQPAAPPCQATIDRLGRRDRLAQLVFVGIGSPGSAQAVDAVHTQHVGGIFLRGNSTEPLVGGSLGGLLAGAAVPVAVSVDEEGGRVQRIDVVAGPIPSARVMARTMSPEQVRELATARGAALRAMGVTIDLAPVADIGDEPDRHAIGDRSFSPDPGVAAAYAGAFAQGLRDSGVLPVVKHFPGHGRASGDSHRGAVATPPIEDLLAADLLPYRQLLAQAPVAAMVGHLIVPGLTDGRPASLSAATYRLLRQEYGFTGVAVTDDLGGMRAVTDRHDLPDAALRALVAGADVVLWSSGERIAEVLTRLENAIDRGELPVERITESLQRVLSAKGVCAG